MTIKVWRRGDLEKMLLLVKGAVGFYESILKDMDEFGINRIMINGGTKDTRFVEACSDMIKKSCDEADIGIKAAIQGNDRRSWRTQYRDEEELVDRHIEAVMDRADKVLNFYKHNSRVTGTSSKKFQDEARIIAKEMESRRENKSSRRAKR